MDIVQYIDLNEAQIISGCIKTCYRPLLVLPYRKLLSHILHQAHVIHSTESYVYPLSHVIYTGCHALY